MVQYSCRVVLTCELVDAPATDVELIVEVARGRTEALGALYDRHAEWMLALGRRILARSPEAEDVLHGVFEEVWKRAGDYDPSRATVRTWLAVRMRSRCIDRLRRQPVADSEMPELVLEGRPDRALDGRRARQALETLSVEQRSVLELVYFDGMSFSEVAQHLSIPVGTAKSRARLGLERLRSALGVVEAST